MSEHPARPGATAPVGTRTSGGRRGRLLGRSPMGCLGRLLALLLVLGAAGVGVVAWAYASTDLPNPNALASSQVNIVYFADGRTEVGRISSGANRESVELSQIPKPVQQAFLAAEDRSFYTNSGISPSGIARAVWVGIRGGQTQGGSTITQQYVKNYFLSSDQTYRRKIKEIFLAIKLDQSKTKDEILRDYLNTIYFGRGAYGIQTASKAYFDKDVSRLTPAEGAVLASIVRGPSLYDPSLSAANKKRNTARATWILDSMVQLGWLPKAERAGMTIPDVVAKKPVQVTGGTNGYVVAAARAELKTKARLTDEDIERGGLKIVTTIDKAQQDKAVEAVERYTPQGRGFRVGFAAVKPGNGGITAMYGGPDFLKQQFNDATQGAVPAGSTFKVFTLAAALEKGVNSRSTVDGDEPYVAPGTDKEINNSEGEGDMGTLQLRNALAKSVNTAFARLNLAITPKATADMATRLGVTVPEADRNIVGNTLGLTDATPVTMAAAYATFAAKGSYAAPHVVASVRTADGTVRFTGSTATTRVLDEKVVADVVDAMKRVVEDGTATDSVRGRGLTRPAAGKTGTGEDSTSAWFDGFIPQMAAAVSMVQLDEKNTRLPMQVDGGPVYGGGIPTKIWARFMVKAFGDAPVEQLPERAGVGRIVWIGSEPTLGELAAGVPDGQVQQDSGSQDSGSQGSQGSQDSQGSGSQGTQQYVPPAPAPPVQQPAPAPTWTDTQTATQQATPTQQPTTAAPAPTSNDPATGVATPPGQGGTPPGQDPSRTPAGRAGGPAASLTPAATP